MTSPDAIDATLSLSTRLRTVATLLQATHARKQTNLYASARTSIVWQRALSECCRSRAGRATCDSRETKRSASRHVAALQLAPAMSPVLSRLQSRATDAHVRAHTSEAIVVNTTSHSVTANKNGNLSTTKRNDAAATNADIAALRLGTYRRSFYIDSASRRLQRTHTPWAAETDARQSLCRATN